MEGRALDRHPRHAWAWVLVSWAAVVVQAIESIFVAPRVSVALLGLGVGVGWQLLFRRDLVSRLTVMACVAAVVITARLVAGEERIFDGDESTLLFLVCLLIGLVFAEQYLRWRDSRVSPAAPATTPGTARR